MYRLLAQSCRLICATAMAGVAACGGGDGDARHVGYVEADWVYVAAPRAGWIGAQHVREGDTVEPGTLLFTLDARAEDAALAEARARLAQAEANFSDLLSGARPAELRALEARLRQAQAQIQEVDAELRRVLPLVDQGLENPTRGERLQAQHAAAVARAEDAQEQIAVAQLAGRSEQIAAAKAGVQAAVAQLRDREIAREERDVKALVAGVVDELFHHRGEYAKAGAPLLALIPPDGRKIRFYVSPAELAAVSVGDRIRASADGLPEPFDAVISYVASDAEFTPPIIYSQDSREKLLFRIDAAVPSGLALRPGLPVDVQLPGR